jgi:prophage regulatory protein
LIVASINHQQVQANAQARILKRKQVEERTGLPRSSIYAGIAAGTFPAQIHLSAKSVGWLESEVNGWIADRIEQSPQIEAARLAKVETARVAKAAKVEE